MYYLFMKLNNTYLCFALSDTILLLEYCKNPSGELENTFTEETQSEKLIMIELGEAKTDEEQDCSLQTFECYWGKGK